MKMRIFLSVLFLFFLTGSVCFAQGFQLSKDLIDEIRVNQREVSANPNDATANFELAMTYAYTGFVERGLKYLKKVGELDPHYADVVVAKYSGFLQEEPDNWKYLFKLAFGYYFAEPKARDKALMCFSKILEKNPNQFWVMGYMALLKGEVILNEKDKLEKEKVSSSLIHEQLEPSYQEVIALCKKALSIEPNAAGIHFLLGETYRNKGDYWGFIGEVFTAFKLQKEMDNYLKQAGL